MPSMPAARFMVRFCRCENGLCRCVGLRSSENSSRLSEESTEPEAVYPDFLQHQSGLRSSENSPQNTGEATKQEPVKAEDLNHQPPACGSDNSTLVANNENVFEKGETCFYRDSNGFYHEATIDQVHYNVNPRAYSILFTPRSREVEGDTLFKQLPDENAVLTSGSSPTTPYSHGTHPSMVSHIVKHYKSGHKTSDGAQV